MASSCTTGDLDWTLVKNFFTERVQALEQAAQVSALVVIPGGTYKTCRCGTYGCSLVMDLAVLDLWFDFMILKLFSSLNNSMIL